MTTKATTAFSTVPKFQEANEIIVFTVFRNLRKQKKFSKISPKKFPFHSTCNIQKNSQFNGLPQRLRNHFQRFVTIFVIHSLLSKTFPERLVLRKQNKNSVSAQHFLNVFLWLRREISSIIVYSYSSSGKFAYN